MRRRRARALGAIGLLIALASSARAADPRNVREAERRFQRGVHLMATGRPDEARVQFAEANALVRSTDILWNLIAAETDSGHYADALNHARQFVRDPKAPPEDVRNALAKLIPELLQNVGQVDVVAPAGAQIEVDAKERVGHAPLLDPYAVPPGPHGILAIAGTDRFSESITVAAGETVRVALLPSATAAPPPAEPATAAGGLPPFELEPEPGSARSPSGAATADRTSGAARARVWTTAGFGAGAVLLTAGSVVLFVAAQSSRDAAATWQSSLPPGACPASPGCADLESDLHRQNDEFHAAEGLLIGAGVAVVGAVVSWVVLGPRRGAAGPAASLLVAPTPGAPGRGFVVQGSF
jgi:hypothetical protein